MDRKKRHLSSEASLRGMPSGTDPFSGNSSRDNPREVLMPEQRPHSCRNLLPAAEVPGGLRTMWYPVVRITRLRLNQ